MNPKPNHHNSNRLFVFSNFAVTADGKIAFDSRDFAPFGSDRDREHMMELRATADAVIAGARTAEKSGVKLGSGGKKYQQLRRRRGLADCHLRIIVSGAGSVDVKADIFKHRFSPILFLVSEQISQYRLRQLRGLADDVLIFGEKEIDFLAALRCLRHKWKVQRLLCEGGGQLHAALVRAGLIDELHLTFCPLVFGRRTACTLADGHNIVKLADAVPFKFQSAKRYGDELFVVLKAANQG